MDYYNYPNLNCKTSNEIAHSSVNNKTNSFYYANYGYHHNTVHADPRLNNYMCYNPAIATSQNVHPGQEFGVPSMYELVPTKSTPVLETKTDDELWIETWLSKIGKIQINLNSTVEIKPSESENKLRGRKNVIPIHTAKHLLKNSLEVLGTLQQMQESLMLHVATMSSEEWKKKTTEIGHIKDQFSKLVSPFENPELMTNLRRTVEKRRKKRATQKRQKNRRSEYLKEMYENRQKADITANQWLENKKQEVERVTLEEKMKKDADCVLAEVTKKKSDARKLSTLIYSLVKLRQIREHAALQKGEKVSSEDHSAFSTATNKLDKIWTDTVQVYIKEEQELLKKLQQNATDDSNAAQAAKEKHITEEWDTAFFGSECKPLPTYWGLTIAERDLETFIAIRRSWDTFLTKWNDTNGSRIPIGWVTPNPNASESWTKYRV